MSSATEHLSNFDHRDQETRKKARVIAILALLFWLLVLVYPIFSYTFPLPEKPGILLSFGEPDGGGELARNLQAVKEKLCHPLPSFLVRRLIHRPTGY